MAQDVTGEPEPMVAYDHTDLLNRPKRIWNWGNIPLPGLLLPALGAAFGFGVVWMVTLLSLSAFVPALGMSILTAVLYFGPPVGVYFVWGRPLPSALTLSQQLVVWADYWWQPKRLQGLAADREPGELHWQVILWQPGSQRWQQSYERALNEAARHGSSYGGTEPPIPAPAVPSTPTAPGEPVGSAASVETPAHAAAPSPSKTAG
ncbi:hypothetical protein ABZ958_11175 [Streptomyces sp. NPDC046237]|uniref:hypothetical protein n=1 Tax=Streptomyces sp. NPDC046237 TaxID=3154914 RepID=UPI00340EB7FD